ncbi:hypothetical protein JMJ56_28910 [Belnapia sp. T18]|uniref:Uncharacterized protein n=1 Tax=Belnapia arida TaxID=2804533 RepID=A0ABS1UBW0_9PROT|nr:hypothetical protein [Belnapia arida]MBL6082005.1 hypothetical protein [Belnapia arida]
MSPDAGVVAGNPEMPASQGEGGNFFATLVDEDVGPRTRNRCHKAL